MAGGRGTRPAASRSKAPVKTDGLLDSLWAAPDSSTMFNGSTSTDFESQLYGGMQGNTEDDVELEGYSQLGGKKRRLSAHQVQFLEQSFEVENRLEPERKTQLAKELGLQPRQVAIWFQNRRARFKTKQMEKDYDSLRACYDNLRADYECLLKEKEKLRHEVDCLKNKLIGRSGSAEEDDKNTKPSKSICPSKPEQQQDQDRASEERILFESESPWNSSQGPEPESSEIEDGNSFMIGEPFSYYNLPKVEDMSYDCGGDRNVDYGSCGFGLSTEDHPFWNWTY